MKRRILVTGAAGFIGSHTVDLLLQSEHNVLGIDNFRTGKRKNLGGALGNPNFYFVESDATDEAALMSICRHFKPEVIIHLAGLVSVPESFSNRDLNKKLNYTSTSLIAKVSERYLVERIVFSSTAAVYGDCSVCPIVETAEAKPSSPYAEAKLDSENLLREVACRNGLVTRSLRYFNVYGPRQDANSPYSGVITRFRENLRLKEAPTIFGDGKQTRDFISVFDVARANLLASTATNLKSDVVNICTGHGTSINELWRLQSITAPTLAPKYEASRIGDIRQSVGSGELARFQLAFVPTIRLADGLNSLD